MAESTVVACPSCGKKYKIGTDKLGRTFKCTGCETKFKAGEELEPVAAPAVSAPEVSAPVVSPPAVVVEPPDESEYESSTNADEPVSAPVANYSDNTTGKPKTSGLAITSLVCGLLGCIPGVQILAVIFGFLGLKKIKTGLAGGKGLAITGIILGVLGIILYGAVGVAGYMGYAKGSGFFAMVAGQATLRVDMARIRQSIVMYQQKNAQHFPADLATLWKSDPSLNGKVFVVANTSDTPAATPEELAMPGHSSFTYIYPGPDATSVTGTDLLLYVKNPAPGTNQLILMFGDGSEKTCTPAELPGYIAKTAKHVTMPVMP